MTFEERYARLKERVGGLRAERGYQEIYGQTPAERELIAPPSKFITRAIGQMDFAYSLTKTMEHASECLERGLRVLEDGLTQQGVLTREVCERCEEALMPLSDAAREYSVICAAHAHIDMNWMWSYQETVALTLSTLRTMLSLMREYPDFHYSQSQASVYKIVEEFDPSMMDEIKARIREGRWEVTATAWVETDKNMPDAESLLAHIRLTRAYMRDVWGVPQDSTRVDFSPDTFGHGAFIPELNAFADVPYYYHCRGKEMDEILFRWQSPSGREALVYREPYWYNGRVTARAGTGVAALSQYAGGLKTALYVYGVGNHGGGPSRRDIECIQDMQRWPVFPRLRFGTFHEYFKEAETVRDRVKLYTGELNPIFTGCYTTQSHIKRAHKRTESALIQAQGMSALAARALGCEYPRKRFDRAAEHLLFTQFHDLLPGSCKRESREHALGILQESMAINNTELERAAQCVASRIDTSSIPVRDEIDSCTEGAGAGYGVQSFSGVPATVRGMGRTRVFHAFNPAPSAFEGLVRLTLWDWPYDPARIALTTCSGETVPFECVEGPLDDWNHMYYTLLARVCLPAFGYGTLVLGQKDADDLPVYRLTWSRGEKPKGDITLENEHLRVNVDGQSGAVLTIYDLDADTEAARDGSLVLVDTEARTSNAWNIGRYLRETPLDRPVRVQPYENRLRQGVKLEYRVLQSKVFLDLFLDAGARALSAEIKTEWNETANGDDPAPLLCWRTRLASKPDVCVCDIPGGVQAHKEAAIDVPGLTHIAAPYKDRALCLVTDSKYGYRYDRGMLYATLINTSRSPDPSPERGEHNVSLFLALGKKDAAACRNAALSLTRPPYVLHGEPHQGTLPPDGALLSVEADTCVVSGVSLDDQGALLIRMIEMSGKDCTASVRLPFTPREAVLCDAAGRAIGTADHAGDSVRFLVKAQTMACVKVI